MDLIADLGNTRAHVALFDGGRLVARCDVLGGAPLEEKHAAWDALLAGRAVARAALASVNPTSEEALAAWARARLGVTPLLLGRSLQARLAVAVARERLGADRLAHALWAARRHAGRACVVASCGTATSFVVVSRAGVLEGGAIAPGLGLQARALSERTALLPLVSIPEPPPPIGRDTGPAIEAGIYWGTVGLLELYARKVEEALGERPVLAATGGDAALLARGCARIDAVVPDLTLEGVAIALEEARPQ